ncbi:MerR family transcriptional regulator [Streptomyces sp. NL15-2K]|uniref:DNA polymerase III subunit beta family protein n=1 Tax=Streptomyces sp. NL15-2K TaxID=376149 RepID=UPI000F57CBEA|nr:MULTISPECIES: MerR family transcriptional regulator [Actinomycetes]WKX10849.1 MerR family transcriptional regulator [Kutzneria buriramensis]GCB47592.1 merR family transcriptional regulator [Streptomyces sp. NL15-2K]
MDDTDGLMSIGAFARQVGLAPSALRFYDDCGVLPPAHVDEATGYRYYAPDQENRAILVRRLREAGMPLTDTSVVLDGTREEARAVLAEHAHRARETAASAQAATERILRDLLGGAAGTEVRLGGAELAGAVRQVAPAVASGAGQAEFPTLGCVLVEVDREEVRLVATDRYRLAVRALRPTSGEGVRPGPCHVLVDVRELRDAASWAMRLPTVDLEVDEQGARLRDGDAVRVLPTVDGTFPEYRMILDDLPTPRHRVIVDRAALRTVIADAGYEGPVTLHAQEQRLELTSHDSGTSGLAAICTGPPVRIAFDPAVLVPALDAGVGPDVLLEISSPVQPVVVRSADQGSFTTLVMPVQVSE